MEVQAKRRRVTRACDECRKKKVKCDGKQPCIHCTVYNYACTYSQPSRRAAGSSSLKKAVAAAINSESGNAAAVVGQGSADASGAACGSCHSSASVSACTSPATDRKRSADASSGAQHLNKRSVSGNGAGPAPKKYSTSKNKQLLAKVAKYEELLRELIPEMPDIAAIDVPTFAQLFHNTTKDVNFGDMVQEYKLIAPTEVSPIVTRSDALETGYGSGTSYRNGQGVKLEAEPGRLEAIENIDGSIQSHEGKEIKIILPPKPIAIQFIKSTWENCCVLFRFYHRPSFISQLDLLYETDPENYTHEQMEFLPLCYAVMAVGALFTKTVNRLNEDQQPSSNNDASTKFLQDEGYKYFIAARKLIDITNARDLNSIQTIVLLFLFLQCSARLSTSYSYIGVAMRSALREGLHRKLDLNATKNKINYIEVEMRKRLFYTIYKMDIYINTMLGLPRTISSEDFDQELPLDLTDDYITEDAIYPEEQGDVLSSAGIANQHTKILMILDQIMAELYPIKKTNNLISHQMITNLELKLRQWLDQLPPELIPGLDDVPEKYLRANRLLHLSFLQVQIILYRPFIHYLSPTSPQTDQLSVQRAKNCISVAQTVVKLAKDMTDAKILPGSYWFSIYTIFFSVAALIYYGKEFNPISAKDIATYDEIMQDIKTGKLVLLKLKETSVAASRTYNLLTALFDSFNAKTKQSIEMQNKMRKDRRERELKPDSAQSLSDLGLVDFTLNPSNENAVISPDPSNAEIKADSTPSLLSNTFNFEPNTSISGVNTLNTSQTANLFSSTNLTGAGEQNSNDGDKFFLGDQNQNAQSMQHTPQFISSNTPNQIPESNIDGTYVPGMFDQLDVQLFGRYLPPYMSSVTNNEIKPKDESKDEIKMESP